MSPPRHHVKVNVIYQSSCCKGFIKAVELLCVRAEITVHGHALRQVRKIHANEIYTVTLQGSRKYFWFIRLHTPRTTHVRRDFWIMMTVPSNISQAHLMGAPSPGWSLVNALKWKQISWDIIYNSMQWDWMVYSYTQNLFETHNIT